MFLSEIEENLLKLFPLAVKRTLVKAVVDDLNKREQSRGSSPVVIITPTHANWVMECVGQGFGLPYSDAPIISSVLMLYKTWLFQNRPPGMLQEEQYFLRKIAQHFSLLFEHRKDDNGQLIKETESIEDVRCRLCLQALQEIYLAAVRKFGPEFTPETWDCYLKIVLTIMDVILTWDSKKVLDHLATYALRTLIEIWCLSKTRDILLWGALRALCVNHEWIGRTISTIHQFNQINLSLTNQAIRAMYGEPYGEAHLSIDFAIEARLERVDQVILDFSTEDCYFFWYKFQKLVGNICNITAPDTYRLAFDGVEKIVDRYIAIGSKTLGDLWKEKDSLRPNPPTATAILNIFGNCLFEACTLDKAGFEWGTSVAIRTLCKIICDTVNIEPILPRYLASFYACVGKMLLKPTHNMVSHALLQEGRKIFVKNLRGSHVLIPHFLHGIGVAWANGRTPSAEVGVACSNLLISLCQLPNVYHLTSFNPLLLGEAIPTSSLGAVQYYRDILPHIQNILMVAFRSEHEVKTLQSLLWCYSIAAVEICDSYASRGAYVAQLDQEWIVGIAAIIVEKVGVWHNRAMMAALEVLSFLAFHVSKHLISSASLSLVVVSQLTNRILKHGVSPSNDEETLHFIASCYKCISDWITLDGRHNLYHAEHEVGILLAKAIQQGIESQHETHQRAAQFLYHRIMTLSDSPVSQFTSSVFSEVNFLEAIAIQHGTAGLSPVELWNTYGQYVRWISLNGQIISIIDQPDLDGNICTSSPAVSIVAAAAIARDVFEAAPRVNVIVRGPCGKQVFDVKMTVFGNHANYPSSLVPQHPSEINPQPAVVYDNLDTSREAVTIDFEPELYFNVEDIIAREQGCLLMSDYGLDADVQFQVPVRPAAELWAGENKSQYTRLFLAHMGLLVPNTYEMVNFLSADHVFHQGLALLDAMSERETLLSSVLFWQKGQKTAEDVFENLVGSLEYSQFLDSLGWNIIIDQHTGFTADLQYSTIVTPYGLPYYSDSTHEFLFLVGTLISNGETQPPPEEEPQYDEQGQLLPPKPRNKKHEELLRSGVFIIWLEDEYDWNPSLLTNFGQGVARIYIVILPLNNGLYRVWIQLDGYEKAPDWVEEEGLYSIHSLSIFIRRILKISHSICQPSAYQDGYWHLPNYLNRSMQIQNILNTVESNLTLQEYYAYLLSSATPLACTEPRKPRVKYIRAPKVKVEEKVAPAALKPMVVPKPDVVLPLAKVDKKHKKGKNKTDKKEKGNKSVRATSSDAGAPASARDDKDKKKRGFLHR